MIIPVIERTTVHLIHHLPIQEAATVTGEEAIKKGEKKLELIWFSFLYHSTSINRVIEHDTLEEVKTAGLEVVADQCIGEIKQAIGLDLKELAKPNDYYAFCSFIELKHNHENNEITEKNRISVK